MVMAYNNIKTCQPGWTNSGFDNNLSNALNPLDKDLHVAQFTVPLKAGFQLPTHLSALLTLTVPEITLKGREHEMQKFAVQV